MLRRPTPSSHSHCTHSHTSRTRIRTSCLHVFVSTRCVYVGSVSTWLAWVGRLRFEVGGATHNTACVAALQWALAARRFPRFQATSSPSPFP